MRLSFPGTFQLGYQQLQPKSRLTFVSLIFQAFIGSASSNCKLSQRVMPLFLLYQGFQSQQSKTTNSFFEIASFGDQQSQLKPTCQAFVSSSSRLLRSTMQNLQALSSRSLRSAISNCHSNQRVMPSFFFFRNSEGQQSKITNSFFEVVSLGDQQLQLKSACRALFFFDRDF